MHLRRRSGFTLIELLAALVIMAIIASLVAAAAFVALGRQRVANSSTTISKIAPVLLRQWQAVVKQASTEQIPAEILNTQYDTNNIPISWGLLDMAGANLADPTFGLPGAPLPPNVEKRARVIWVKLRLKQQFPMTLAEAVYPTPPNLPFGGANQLNPVARGLGGRSVTYFAPLGPPFPNAMLPPNQTYLRTLAQASLGSVPLIQISPTDNRFPLANAVSVINQQLNNPNGVPAPNEAAICLWLALRQSRGGAVLNEEELGTGVLTDVPNVAGLKQFVDAWGVPLTFNRFPTADPAVDQSSPAKSGSAEARFRDPLDPEGLLLDPAWNNPRNYATYQGVWAFEMLLHPICRPGATASPGDPNRQAFLPWSYFTVPVVSSAGPNSAMGYKLWSYPPIFQPQLPTPLYPLPPALWPNLMQPDGTEATLDNIQSYQLRLGGQ